LRLRSPQAGFADGVYQLAADMGATGFIHSAECEMDQVLLRALRRLASICRNKVFGCSRDKWLRFIIRAWFGDRPITLGVSLISADSGNGGRAFAPHFIRTRRQRMRLQPKRTGSAGRIDASIFPPCCLVATAMDLAMMAAAERRRELIADPAAKRPMLGEAQMMRI
jgi:hypothetical protein